jgi:hypothetical protein
MMLNKRKKCKAAGTFPQQAVSLFSGFGGGRSSTTTPVVA